MRFSAKSEYALRALIDLANYYGQGTVGIKEIANRQGIPERFLEQQMSALRKAGIIITQRGAHGGVVLSRAPSEITVYDIVEALEGPLTTVTCVGASASECAKNAHCAVQDLWSEVYLSVKNVLKKTTLENLARRQNNYDRKHKPMFYI
jgi:Rrf2 family protein